MTEQRPSARPSGLVFSTILLAALIGFGLLFDHGGARPSPGGDAIAALDRDLAREGWSPDVRQLAAWAIRSKDHDGKPFVVIDQARARLYAFDVDGRLAGSTPILSGGWHDQTAPAGRFVADARRSTPTDRIVWANRETALALRAAPATGAAHSLGLARHHHHDHLVARGAVHVAGEFYRQHLRAFRSSIAYVLPNVLPLRRAYPLYAWGPENQIRSAT